MGFPNLQEFEEVYEWITRVNVLVIDYAPKDGLEPEDILPPSDNHIRIPIWNKKRIVYSKEAQRFFKLFVHQVQPARIFEEQLDPNGCYYAQYLFGFPRLDYLPDRKDIPRMRHGNDRLIVQDVYNREKLIGDAIAQITSVDDHRIMASAKARFESDAPCLRIRVHELDWHGFLVRASLPPLPRKESVLNEGKTPTRSGVRTHLERKKKGG